MRAAADTRDHGGVVWDEQVRRGPEAALNEAEVVGLRIASSDSACELLLHVCAQPEQEAKDSDPRRVLRLLGATRIRLLLREDRQDGYGPAMAFADLDDVELFFASLGGWDAMYGREFLDRPSRRRLADGDKPNRRRSTGSCTALDLLVHRVLETRRGRPLLHRRHRRLRRSRGHTRRRLPGDCRGVRRRWTALVATHHRFRRHRHRPHHGASAEQTPPSSPASTDLGSTRIARGRRVRSSRDLRIDLRLDRQKLLTGKAYRSLRRAELVKVNGFFVETEPYGNCIWDLGYGDTAISDSHHPLLPQSLPMENYFDMS
jgi:hypothetical protein